MKKKTITGLTAITVIVVFVLFTGCFGDKGNTYSKFGFSFDYPAGMKIEEKGYPFFSVEANAEAGVLYFKKSQLRIDVSWVTLEDVDRSYIEKQIDAYLSGRREGINFYQGDPIESKHMGHTVLGTRFVTQGVEGILLNVTVSWYCDSSKRLFMITVAADWEHPVFITDGTRMIPEWPDLNHDPSYSTYEKVINSFQCH